MSQVMGPDQTLRLVQLYRDHYADISRHTQDVEGRKRKMQVWKDITDELNTTFSTSFSVEQYKKKLQNVQCTSRQKLQTGRGRPGKNTRVGPGSRFSAAESEFIRLFEDHNGVFDSFRHDSGASSVDALTDGDANIKMEDFLQTLGFSGFNANIFDSDGGNTDEGENFNKSLLSKLGQLGQQLLEQQSTFSALNGLNVNVPNGANPNPEANDSPQISPATSSSNDPVANSVENVRKRESSTQEAKPVTNGHVGHEAGNHVLFKRRRKAVPVENGHDDLWKNEFLEVQKKILENQEKILKSLEEKPKNEQPEDWKKAQKSLKSEYHEAKLNALLSLGNKLDRLCDVVSSLEKSIQNSIPKVVATPEA